MKEHLKLKEHQKKFYGLALRHIFRARGVRAVMVLVLVSVLFAAGCSSSSPGSSEESSDTGNAVSLSNSANQEESRQSDVESNNSNSSDSDSNNSNSDNSQGPTPENQQAETGAGSLVPIPIQTAAFSTGLYSTPEFQEQRREKAGQSALQGTLRRSFWEGFMPLIDTSRIISGGPRPDGIPPIDNPDFLSPDEVDFLAEQEPVIALEVNGEKKAYPVQILTHHEIVNDEIGGVPVAVTYCPLCNSAIAYKRQLGDPDNAAGPSELLDFGTSGSLFNSSLVMYDRQTETLWTHFDGRAVIGELEGLQLEFIPAPIVSWADWRDSNPKGTVLNRVFSSSGNPIRNYGVNPYEDYLDDTNILNPAFLDISEVDSRLPVKELVIGVRLQNEGETDAIAILRESLERTGAIDFVLEAGEEKIPLTAWHFPGTTSGIDALEIAISRDVGSVAVFRREIDGRTLDFERRDGRIFDTQTGSEWDVFGQSTGGELVGTRLIPYESLDTFWFSWAGFNPETRILP